MSFAGSDSLGKQQREPVETGMATEALRDSEAVVSGSQVQTCSMEIQAGLEKLRAASAWRLGIQAELGAWHLDS